MPGKRHAAQRELSAKQAAENLGMTDVSVGEWGAKSGAPVIMRGGRRYYLWPAFPIWYREQLRAAREKPADFEAARARKIAAEAELAEYELAVMRGTVHRDEECLAAFDRILEELRAQILVAPGKWAHRFVNLKSMVDAQRTLDELTRALLKHLSGHGDRDAA